MVFGESADFMLATIEANRTYYALILPRMGIWKARFSLKPVHSEKMKSSQFSSWLNGSEWVENTPNSERWAINNMAEIQSNYREYYEYWMNKRESERPKLLPQDGKLHTLLEPATNYEETYIEYGSPANSVDTLDDGATEYYSPQE